MSKPSKYTPDTTKRLLDAVRSGFTVKMACAMAGVTDMTLSRWRRQYSDFDAEFKKATEEQTWYARKALKKAKIRTYERKTHKCPQKGQKVITGQIRGSDGHITSEVVDTQFYEGLPVRLGSIAEDKPYTPCVNPSNGRVEYLKRENGYNVQHVCNIEVFKRSFPGWYRKIQEQYRHPRDAVRLHL